MRKRLLRLLAVSLLGVVGSASGLFAATAPAVNTNSTAPWGALWRQPAAGRTLVFPRSQVKYGLYQNYYRRWLDRPLLHDTSLRSYIETSTHAMKYPGFAREMKTVRDLYDADGLAQILAANMVYGLPAFDFADRAGVDGFGVLPEFSAIKSESEDAMRSRVVETALASRSAVRLNGKILITSYLTMKPEEWKAVLDKLRAKHGDVFIFLPQLDLPDQARLFNAFDANGGQLPEAERQKLKAFATG